MKKRFYQKVYLLCAVLILTSHHLFSQYWESVGSVSVSPGVSAMHQITVSPQGNIYVAYIDAGLDLRATVKMFDGTDWETVGNEGFTNGWVHYLSLKTDPAGTVYLAFNDVEITGKASVMYWNGSEWDYLGSPDFSAGDADFVDMAIDKHGTPYVVYRDYAYDEKCTVKKFDGTDWVNVGLPGFSSPGPYQSIAIDSSGAPYVSFQDAHHSFRATVMKFNGFAWEIVGIPGFSMGAALYTSMAIDKNNVPHVAFQDNGYSGKAKVMKFDGTNWVNVGTPGLTPYPNLETRLDFTPDNVPILAYKNGNDIGSQIAVERFRNGTWEIMGSVGISQGQADFISMALDSVGIPYLTYRDGYYFNKASVKKYVPATIYVDASMPNDNQNGLTWTWAKKNLQAALDIVENGGQIWVKKGVYTPTSTWDIPDATARDQHFRMKKHVKIIGGLAGTEGYFSNLDNRDFVVNETVLSGDIGVEYQNSDNCYHIFNHPTGLGLSETAILDGFTITLGNADGENERGSGGAIVNQHNSPLFKNCIFTENIAANSGGAVFNENSNPLFNACIIRENTSANGAGIFNTDNSNLFAINCLITDNSAQAGAGGIFSGGSEMELINTTIAGNDGSTCGGIHLSDNSTATISNSILWGNSSPAGAKQLLLNNSAATLNYSCYANGANDVVADVSSTFSTENMNIITDPNFVDVPAGDYRLFGNSPSINHGLNAYNNEPKDLRMKERVYLTIIDQGPYEWNDAFDPFQVFYVDGERADDSGNGLSWATAKKTLQAAINQCGISDQVWVKAGEYRPTVEYGGTGSRFKSFQLKNGIGIYGGFSGSETSLSMRDITANPTILSGDLNGDDNAESGNKTDNSYHVFYHPATLGLTLKTMLDGFTIKGGNADGEGIHSYGAAFNNEGGSITLKNLVICDNQAFADGGALYFENASPHLENCIIKHNSGEAGGAAWFKNCPDFYLVNCVVANNEAITGCAGIDFTSSTGDVINTTVARNNSQGNGGGLALSAGSQVVLVNSIIYLNEAVTGNQFFLQQSSTANLTCTCFSNLQNDIVEITGGDFHPASGTTSVYPRFIDVTGEDYRLSGNSGLIDNGSNSVNLTNNDVRGSGFSRYINKTTGNSGNIDIGAYEFQPGFDPSNWIMFVKENASGKNNGYTWADAFTTLQPALSMVIPGDIIWIAAGTYLPSATVGGSDSRYKTFQLKNNVSVVGGFSGEETIYFDLLQRNFTENETILSGDLARNDNYTVTPWTGMDENCYHVFKNVGIGLNTTAILDGVTISGGNASYWGDHFGPGMQNMYNSSPTVRYCKFTNNTTVGNGGGIYNYVACSPVIEYCLITNNIALSSGGGIFSHTNCNPVICNTTISDNKTTYHGGGICNENYTTSTITNCVISGNTCQWFGGGVYYESYCPVSITHTTIINNHASINGGGIYTYQNTGIISNCLVIKNTSPTGAGIFNYSSSLTFVNSTIAGNTATNNGGGIYTYSQSSQNVLNNSIVWGNQAGQNGKQFYLDAANVTLNFSCYSNETNDTFLSNNPCIFSATNNNITTNPMFVDDAVADFRIFGYSPCINTGSNTYNTAAFDIRGNERVQNQAIDMGAFEWSAGVDPGAPPQMVEIPAGWSGFSSFLSPTNADIVNVLAPILDELIIVKNYTHVYWPGMNINTIGNFDHTQGYYIKTSAPVSLQINGSVPENSSVQLATGWNLMPVLSSQPVATSVIHEQLGINLIIISEISGNNVFWPGAGVFSLETLQPGKAYHIKVSAPCEVNFTY